MRYRPASSNSSSSSASTNGVAIAIPPLKEWRKTSPTPTKKSSIKKVPLGLLSLNERSNRLSFTTNGIHKPMTPLSTAKDRSSKRHKPEQIKVVIYPNGQDIAVPSKKDIRILYEHSISCHGSINSNENGLHSSSSHQRSLDAMGAGVLSFEQVLLPAVAKKEADALKLLQSRSQRDDGTNTNNVKALQMCRRAIYESVAEGIHAAKEARLQHEIVHQQRERNKQEQERQTQFQIQEEKKEQRRLRRKQRAANKQASKDRRKLEAKKKFPPTLELWREVASLMNELRDLQKEEKMWKETEHSLFLRENELQETQKSLQSKQAQHPESSVIVELQEGGDSENSERPTEVDQAVDQVTISAVRIQHTINLLVNLITSSNSIRKEIYSKYREDHQFHGYQGVKDPKGLIRALAWD